MELIVNSCVILTAVFAFGYLCYVMVRPERF
jgi:K+-transporting ATPase KdpF subunit